MYRSYFFLWVLFIVSLSLEQNAPKADDYPILEVNKSQGLNGSILDSSASQSNSKDGDKQQDGARDKRQFILIPHQLPMVTSSYPNPPFQPVMKSYPPPQQQSQQQVDSKLLQQVALDLTGIVQSLLETAAALNNQTDEGTVAITPNL